MAKASTGEIVGLIALGVVESILASYIAASLSKRGVLPQTSSGSKTLQDNGVTIPLPTNEPYTLQVGGATPIHLIVGGD
jgi:hypothetical protein